MSIVIFGLLSLTAASLGLRTVAAFLGPGVHPVVRIIIGLLVGAVISAAFLQFCDNYRVLEFGLGLLISLSPAGVFDVMRWWFRWRAGVPQ